MRLEYRLDFFWADLSAVVEGIKGLCKGAFTTRALAPLTAFASSVVLVGSRVVAEGAFHLALLPFRCFYLTFPRFFDSQPINVFHSLEEKLGTQPQFFHYEPLRSRM